MNTKRILVSIILIVPVLGLLAHWLILYPQDAKQSAYPVESFIASIKSTCSINSPEWMYELMSFSFNQRGSLANQITYRDPSGKIYHCEGGWADHFFGTSVNETHRYRYGSLTKIITADLILQLIDEKKLSLETRLLDIFPEITPVYDQRISQITIANLLDHSAGFNRLTPEGDVMFTSQKTKRWCPYNINQLSQQRLYFNPGDKQIYSNLGYCLLGVVIEKLAGVSYRDYVQQIYHLDEFDIKFVDGKYFDDEVKYDFRFDPGHIETYYEKYDLTASSAAAGLSGNATAFVKLMEKILSRPGLSLLESPVKKRCKNNMEGQCFGFAFDNYPLFQNGKLRLFMHRGYMPGSSSLVIVDSQGGILVMLNASAVRGATKTHKQTIRTIYSFLMKQYDL